MQGRFTMIGCPKPDEGDYTEKLTEVISNKDTRDVTIARMEMPCCVGLWCSDDSYSVGTLFLCSNGAP